MNARKACHRCLLISIVSVSSVQSLSPVRVCVTLWTVAHQVSLSITNAQSSLKLTSIKSVMPSNHLILCDFIVMRINNVQKYSVCLCKICIPII